MILRLDNKWRFIIGRNGVNLSRCFWAIMVLPLSFFSAQAQQLNGVWRGCFTVGLGNNEEKYNYEIQLVSKAGNKIEGIAYSYRNKSFFGKTEIRGKILPDNKLQFHERKLLQLQDAQEENLSFMSCTLENYSLNGKNILEGHFTSFNPQSKKPGASGQIHLVKKSNSSFYKEDFLTKSGKKKPANATAK